MSISYQWDDEAKTIFWIQFTSPWTIADLVDEIDTMYAITSAQSHTIVAIADFTASNSMPPGLLSRAHLIRERVGDNLGTIYLVQPGPLLPVLIELLQRVVPALLNTQVIETASVDEAREKIAASRGGP